MGPLLEDPTVPLKLQEEQPAHEEINMPMECLPCQLEAKGRGHHTTSIEEQQTEGHLLNSSEEEFLNSFRHLTQAEKQAVCERLTLTLKKLKDFTGMETTLQIKTLDPGRGEILQGPNDSSLRVVDVPSQQSPTCNGLSGRLQSCPMQPIVNGCVYRDQEGLLDQINTDL